MVRNLPLLSLSGLLLACGGEPSPVVVGHTTQGAHADLGIEINGDARLVPVDDDAFAVQELPTGKLQLRAEVEGITGLIEVHDVQPGEVVEMDVVAEPNALQMRVVRRDPMSPDSVIIERASGPIHIHGHKVVHHLDPGTYEHDIVIEGKHITLVGPDYYGCRRGGRAILDGDLIIRGDHVRVINLQVLGRTSINGDHVKVYKSCELVDTDLDSDSW